MIICGTDFSQQAAEAVEAAAAIAGKLGEELRLVYAFDKRSSEQILASAEEVVLATIRQRLRNEAERVRKSGVDVEGEILTGTPDEALAQLAESASATLLVVAAIGSRSATFWTLGSVAERVAATAACPVLVIREAQPFVAWARGERPLRVLAGIDASAASDAAVRWLSDLRRIGPCEVGFAHVFSPLEESRRLGVRPFPAADEQTEIDRLLLRELTERLEGLGERDPRLIIQTNLGRPADPLVQIANEQNCDLLVVGSNRRSTLDRARHGSVSYTALHLARMSVASIPVGAGAAAETASRPVIRRILVATDLSATATRAIAWAAAILPPGASLHVVHVATEEGGRDLRDAVAASLPRDLAEHRGARIEVLHGGDIAEEICQAAERESADLICVGSRIHGPIDRTVFGSVAESVIRKTRRPILVVREPE